MLLQPWQVVWLAEQTLRPHCWYPPSATTRVSRKLQKRVRPQCPLLHLLKSRCNSARPAHTTVQSDVPQTYVVGFTSLNTDDFLRSRLADRD